MTRVIRCCVVAAVAAFRVESPACNLLRQEVDAFVAGPQRHSKETVVVSLGGGGLGDQASGFLGSLALAMMTSRRLSLSSDDEFAVVGSALEPTFDVSRVAVGPSAWLSGAPVVHPACENRSIDVARLRTPTTNGFVTDLYCGGKSLEAAFGGRPGSPKAFSERLAKFFTAPVEFVVPGNTGDKLLQRWFDGASNFATRDLHSLAACALRRYLRPSAATERAVRSYAPWRARPEFLVGIHVRADRYLRRDAYGGPADDAVFNCPEAVDVSDFADVFAAAEVAERDRVTQGRSNGTAKWLLVTDSQPLKDAARKAYPDKVLVTDVVPQHPSATASDARPGSPPACPARRLREDAAVDIAAEMLLLSRCDALVNDASRGVDPRVICSHLSRELRDLSSLEVSKLREVPLIRVGQRDHLSLSPLEGWILFLRHL